MRRLQWNDTDHVELRLCGQNSDQVHIGSSVIRGPCSELGEGSGAFALMVALLLYHAELPDHTPLCSCRSVGPVRMWEYGQALRALREVDKQSGRNPKEYALNSLRIGGASTLATGGNMSERVK